MVGTAQPLVRGAQPLAGTGRGTLCGSQPFPIGRVRGADLVDRRSCGLLACRCRRELGPDPISLGLEHPLPLRERGRLAVRPGDPLLVHGEGRLCPSMLPIGLTTLGVMGRDLRGEPVTPRPQFGDACLPRSDGAAIRCLVAVGDAGGSPIKSLQCRAGPGDLRVETLSLRLVPAALAESRFVIPNGDPLHVLGPSPRGNGLRLLVAQALALLAGGGRGVDRCCGSCLECSCLGLEARDVGRQSLRLRSPLEQAFRRTKPYGPIRDDGRSITWHGDPAGGQVGLDGQAGIQVRQPDGPAEEPAGGAVGIAADCLGEDAAAALNNPFADRRVGEGARLAACTCLVHSIRDDDPALGSKPRHSRGVDEVATCRLAEGSLHCASKPWIHDEILVEPPATDASRGLGDTSSFFIGLAREQRVESAPELGQRTCRMPAPFRRGPAGSVGLVGRCPRSLVGNRRPPFGLGGLRERVLRGRQDCFEHCPLLARCVDLSRCLGRTPFDVCQPPERSLVLGMADRFCSPDGSEILAPRPALRTEGRQLGQRVGQRPFGLAELGVELHVPCRDRLRQRPPLDHEIGLRDGTFVVQPGPVPRDALEIRRRPLLTQVEGVDRSLGCVERRTPLRLDDRSRTELLGQPGGSLLSRLKLLHLGVGFGLRLRATVRGIRCPRAGLEPPGMGRQQQCARQLVGRADARGLLLGLGREPPRLRSELGNDVLDPSQVRLRFGQLLLRLAASSLVAPDPGDLLEQRPALLGSQGERLVDHALADEQECIVGEMRAIEQVDEVTQADPLAIEEVVVLAGAVQPPAKLEDLVIDRQQAIGVVEQDRDVRHALRGPALGAGPDDVLGLARAEGTTLLSERPAEGVGQVRLARAIRADDRADAGAELDDGAFRERLEAVQTECEQPGRRRAVERIECHVRVVPGGRSATAVALPLPRSVRSRSSACVAAAVSASRRDGPSPAPRTSPSTQTSTRNTRSWSGPTMSSTR